jgi:hypothetical protein
MTRDIPEPVKRELRQEANFGCVFCGSPIYDYHHIIPKSEEDHDDPDHMVLLCPNHHRLATNGALDVDKQYERKKNPEIRDIIHHDFEFSAETPVLNIGSLIVEIGENSRCDILAIEDEYVISVANVDGMLQFSVDFYSPEGDVVASLTNNRWIAQTEELWDMKYTGSRLRLWNSQQEVGLKFNYDDDEGDISIEGKFDYGKERATIFPSKVVLPGKRTLQDFRFDTGKNNIVTLIHLGDWENSGLDGLCIFGFPYETK